MTRFQTALRNARRNPDIDTSSISVKPQRGVQPATGQTNDTGELVRTFEALWKQLKGPELVKEYKFHPRRRWRVDYCHKKSQVIIEIEGGVYTRGRHVRPTGFIGDCEKYNACAALGYTVFRLPTGMVTPDNVQPIIDYIKRQS